MAIISSILNADYVPSATNLDEALGYLMKAFKKKSYVFLLSDFNDKFDAKSLRVVGNKHQLLGFGVYDEKDLQIPDIGYALLNDAETGEKMGEYIQCKMAVSVRRATKQKLKIQKKRLIKVFQYS